MNRRVAIVDTNIVVAGLLTGDGASPVARVLDGMLSARFPFVVSEMLVAEYRKVLLRPKLRKLHGFAVAQVDELLTQIAHHAIEVKPHSGVPAPEPGDQLLWDLLAVKAEFVLVTGDKLLLHDVGMHARVFSARDFIEGLDDLF